MNEKEIEQHLDKLTFAGPATYCIRIKGRLDESLSERLGGMEIEKASCESEHWQTTLVGMLRDQAALSGVLNTLYELHLPILEVKCLSE